MTAAAYSKFGGAWMAAAAARVIAARLSSFTGLDALLASQRCGHTYRSPDTFPIGMSRAWPISGTIRPRAIRHTSGRLGDLERSRRIPLMILHFDSDSVGGGTLDRLLRLGSDDDIGN
jgi:hypothetical protein